MINHIKWWIITNEYVDKGFTITPLIYWFFLLKDNRPCITEITNRKKYHCVLLFQCLLLGYTVCSVRFASLSACITSMLFCFFSSVSRCSICSCWLRTNSCRYNEKNIKDSKDSNYRSFIKTFLLKYWIDFISLILKARCNKLTYKYDIHGPNLSYNTDVYCMAFNKQAIV